jgi:hypothetical protein
MLRKTGTRVFRTEILEAAEPAMRDYFEIDFLHVNSARSCDAIAADIGVIRLDSARHRRCYTSAARFSLVADEVGA